MLEVETSPPKASPPPGKPLHFVGSFARRAVPIRRLGRSRCRSWSRLRREGLGFRVSAPNRKSHKPQTCVFGAQQPYAYNP